MLSPRRAPLLAVLYAAALIYLSLIPFDFRPLPFGEAWQRFTAIPFLSLGLLDRADWIANLVAYVPLGFFLAAALEGRGRRIGLAGVLLAVGIAVAIAVAIEFTQVFFAPRTVSLNDLLAELLGALAGAWGWTALGDRLYGWMRAAVSGGDRSVRALLWAYAATYLLVGLFPYDFVTNAEELAWKLGSDGYGFLFAPGQCDRFLPCALKLAAESLAAAPLGWLLASYGTRGRITFGAALALGAALGAVLEATQFLLASGRTQGMSVITRAVGLALGAVAERGLSAIGMEAAVRWGRILSIAGASPYLFLLAYASGWIGAAPLALGAALERLPSFQYLPFYYHYYVPEAHALASAIAHVGLYAPIGVAAWLWFRWHPAGPALATVAAGGAALAAELSKSFLPGKHPDLTDVLIAGASAWAVFKALQLATRPERRTDAGALDAGTGGPRPPNAAVSANAGSATAIGRAAGVLVLCAVLAWSVLDLPMLRLALAAGLLAYAALLIWRPQAWLIVLPLLLPVLDLAAWTGRLFWDELDLFVLATLAVRLAIAPPGGSAGSAAVSTRTVIALVVASTAVSAFIGVLPLSPLDANAFSSYYSHYNALRAAKGLAWASVMFLLMRADATRGVDVLALLGKGMVAGLGAATLVIVWERATFPGLFETGADYRVTGLASAMHVGGAYTESFLLAALPFALVAAIFARTTAARVGSAALAALGGYALATTFSRSAYAAVGIELLVFAGLLVAARHRVRPGTGRLAMGIGVGALAVLSLVLVVPVAMGPYASARFAGTGKDAPARLTQWREALRLFEPRPAALLFGMGLGRFPEHYLWGGPPDGRPGTHRFEIEGSNAYLRLGAGRPLYFDQFVPVASQSRYALSLDARGAGSGAALAVALCEKLILYSARCVWLDLQTDPAGGRDWSRYGFSVDVGELGAGIWPFRRPVKLSLTNRGAGTIDVDNVSLRGADGVELVRNGGFAQGLDHWLFAAEDFWPWHIESLFLHTLFEQGIAGLIALLALIGVALGRSLSAPRADGWEVACIASIAGLLAMGMLNTVINAPRSALVFYLVVFSALLIPLASKSRE